MICDLSKQVCCLEQTFSLVGSCLVKCDGEIIADLTRFLQDFDKIWNAICLNAF